MDVKIGARNNRRDTERLQGIHDFAVENGAMCEKTKSADAEEIAIEQDKTFITYGDTVKALPDNKVGGYLVRFTSPDDLDLTGDYFTKETDLGEPVKLPVIYHHGMDEILKNRRIGTATTRLDEVGLWVEAQLTMRDEYEKMVYQLAQEGKLGWSSGAASHVVDKEPSGKGMLIKQWYIAEASLTPSPAEFRNSVIPLKSYISDNTATQSTEGEAEGEKPQSEAGTDKAESTLPIPEEGKEQKKMDITPELLQQTVKQAAEDAVKAYRESEPPVNVKAEANLTVTKAEGDQPWRTRGEFFMAVKDAALRPNATDQRLLATKAATGMNEAIPSQGGFLVPPDIASGVIDTMYKPGSLLGLMQVENISSNRMIYNVVAETSRATGSRYGGITGYWLAEADTKTASKPAFRQLDIVLNKVAAVCVATDELLQDAVALESWLGNAVPNELRFLVEDSIINGDGIGKPLGILTNTDALTSATRTDASEIDPLDIGRMWAGRVPGLDYVWTANQGTFPQLLNMTIGQMPVFLPGGNVAGGVYSTLLGKPLVETEYNPALGTAGDLLLFAPSAYKLIQKGGIESAMSIHVAFTSDQTYFRWVYRIGGAPVYNHQITGFDSGTYSPYVVLTATT